MSISAHVAAQNNRTVIICSGDVVLWEVNVYVCMGGGGGIKICKYYLICGPDVHPPLFDLLLWAVKQPKLFTKN